VVLVLMVDMVADQEVLVMVVVRVVLEVATAVAPVVQVGLGLVDQDRLALVDLVDLEVDLEVLVAQKVDLVVQEVGLAAQGVQDHLPLVVRMDLEVDLEVLVAAKVDLEDQDRVALEVLVDQDRLALVDQGVVARTSGALVVVDPEAVALVAVAPTSLAVGEIKRMEAFLDLVPVFAVAIKELQESTMMRISKFTSSTPMIYSDGETVYQKKSSTTKKKCICLMKILKRFLE